MRRVLLASTMVAGLIGVAPIAHADHKFRATLSGDEEVPPVVSDATGDFRADIDDFDGTLTYRFRINDGVGILQAHLHCAPAGANGAVIVFLAGLPGFGAWDVDGKWIDNASVSDDDLDGTAGCGSTLAELAEAMLEGNVYVNVHTIDHPAGEIRGQLEAQHKN